MGGRQEAFFLSGWATHPSIGGRVPAVTTARSRPRPGVARQEFHHEDRAPDLADRGYRIYIDNGLLTKVGSLLHPWRAAPRLVVISSRPILDLHGRALHRSLSEAGLSHEILGDC